MESADELPAHPLPGSDLKERSLPVTEIDIGWARVHRLEHSAVFFDRNIRGRFNSPDSAYGVMYVAQRLDGAFVETFCRTDSPLRLIDCAEARLRGWSTVRFSRPLRLCDFTGKGLARVGADARLLSGRWQVSRAWAAAIESHPDRLDGIQYRARHDPSKICAAVFDRSELKPAETLEGRFSADDRDQWPDFLSLCEQYEVGIV